MHRKTLFVVCSATILFAACSTAVSDLTLETSYGAEDEEWRVYSCDVCGTQFESYNWRDLKQGKTYHITVFRRDTGQPTAEVTELMTNCDGVLQPATCVEEIIRKAWVPIYSGTVKK